MVELNILISQRKCVTFNLVKLLWTSCFSCRHSYCLFLAMQKLYSKTVECCNPDFFSLFAMTSTSNTNALFSNFGSTQYCNHLWLECKQNVRKTKKVCYIVNDVTAVSIFLLWGVSLRSPIIFLAFDYIFIRHCDWVKIVILLFWLTWCPVCRFFLRSFILSVVSRFSHNFTDFNV